MYRFLEDIKNIIETAFLSDTDISASKKPKVYSGYQVQHEPSQKTPEIQMTPLDNSEVMRYTTFCRNNADSTPLQITTFSGQLKIAGVDYNAQDASILLSEKIDKILYEYIYSGANENILGFRKVSTSPALPMNDGGSIYTTAVRYEFTVANPYVAG